MDELRQMKEEVDAALMDAEKFYGKGNKTAGTRVRQSMQTVKTLAQQIRVNVQDHKQNVLS